MRRTLFRSRSIAIAVVNLLWFSGCVTDFAQNPRNISLVGLWEEDGATVHAISLRKSGGTYRRKVVQLYDYAHPPIVYREDGHWRVNGKRYLFTADHISASRWRKDIGAQRNLKILVSDTKRFKYVSTDGAVVEERRIGDASDAMFDRIQLGDKLRNQKSN
jgi:hypothetical protein